MRDTVSVETPKILAKCAFPARHPRDLCKLSISAKIIFAEELMGKFPIVSEIQVPVLIKISYCFEDIPSARLGSGFLRPKIHGYLIGISFVTSEIVEIPISIMSRTDAFEHVQSYRILSR